MHLYVLYSSIFYVHFNIHYIYVFSCYVPLFAPGFNRYLLALSFAILPTGDLELVRTRVGERLDDFEDFEDFDDFDDFSELP